LLSKNTTEFAHGSFSSPGTTKERMEKEKEEVKAQPCPGLLKPGDVGEQGP